MDTHNDTYSITQNDLDALAESHPNFVNIWKHYIELKKTSLETTLETCRKNIENIRTQDMRDLSAVEINLLILLSTPTHS
jgi:hypothetical protein